MKYKQLIKEEIERRINVCEKYSQLNLTESTRIGNHAQLLELRELKDFIDSIPEETKSEDLDEEIEKKWTNCATWVSSVSGESSLLEESGHYELNLSKSDFKDIAHHFAEWQRNKDKESGCEANFTTKSEDLEEAAKEYSFNIPTNQEISNDWKKETEQHFKDGAMWQKEQMMKEAVNGIMDCDDDNEWIEITDKLIVTPSRAGNKVKIIIYKPE